MAVAQTARRRAAHVVAPLALALVMASAVVAAPALAARPFAGARTGTTATNRPTKPAKLALTGKTTFWECPAKTTSILIGVNRLDLHPGQTLDIDFVVKNLGTKACNYVAPYTGAQPGPTAATLQVGPCGSMGFQIDGPHHRNLWPGLVTFNCPALGFAQLQPGAAVVGSGTWGQSRPTGTSRMPVGSYTLVVDGHFSFPIKLEAH